MANIFNWFESIALEMKPRGIQIINSIILNVGSSASRAKGCSSM